MGWKTRAVFRPAEDRGRVTSAAGEALGHHLPPGMSTRGRGAWVVRAAARRVVRPSWRSIPWSQERLIGGPGAACTRRLGGAARDRRTTQVCWGRSAAAHRGGCTAWRSHTCHLSQRRTRGVLFCEKSKLESYCVPGTGLIGVRQLPRPSFGVSRNAWGASPWIAADG